MNSRALGKTGIEVSELGLGAWQLGERSWNGPGEKKSLRIVDEALALGCAFIDTAPVYGGGRSEELLGQALEGRRDRVVVLHEVRILARPQPRLQPRPHRGVGGGKPAPLRSDWIGLLQLKHPGVPVRPGRVGR